MSTDRPHARFVKASEAFHIGAVAQPGFPIVIQPGTGVCPSSFAYLRELGVIQGRATGTLHDVAGILCLWFNYISDRVGSWTQAPAGAFVDWVNDDDAVATANRARRARRAEVVFDFYEYTARQFGAGSRIEAFVDELAAPFDSNLVREGMKVRRRLRLSPSRLGKDGKRMRPTPSSEEVERIGESLLGDGDSFAEVRNWLLVQTAFETNLRTQGLAQLRLKHVDRMLSEHGISGFATWVSRPKDDVKVEIRSAIDQVENAGYSNFVCDDIFEKSKIRSVVFPLPLMRNILEYVWSERNVLSRARKIERMPDPLDCALWVSRKSRGALKAQSIGDILKSGFERSGVAGSGHRIRAAHAVRLLRYYVREMREHGGGKFDAEAILERVAERMGHSNTSSLRPYLHAVMLEDLL